MGRQQRLTRSSLAVPGRPQAIFCRDDESCMAPKMMLRGFAKVSTARTSDLAT